MSWWFCPHYNSSNSADSAWPLRDADVIADAGLPHHGSNPATAAWGGGFSSRMYQPGFVVFTRHSLMMTCPAMHAEAHCWGHKLSRSVSFSSRARIYHLLAWQTPMLWGHVTSCTGTVSDFHQKSEAPDGPGCMTMPWLDLIPCLLQANTNATSGSSSSRSSCSQCRRDRQADAAT